MGFDSRKRGKLVFFPFRGKKADIMHEFYFILFELILVVLVFAALLAYVNNIAKDLGFEKRYISMDMGILTTVVDYVPGTLKHIYNPIIFKTPVTASYADSLVQITEPQVELPAIVYWYLASRDADIFRSTISLKSDEVEKGVFVPPNITFYKTGKKVALSDKNTNALHIICPTINTTVDDYKSKKIFIAKVLSGSSVSDAENPTNRIANIISAKYPQVSAKASQAASQGSAISAIPADSEMVVVIGDSGEKREPGSFVVYIPADARLPEERKLACMVANEILTDDTSVFYAQIMPVYIDSLKETSPLKVFKERSSPNQVMIFLDISKFTKDQVNVDNTADAIYRGIQRYYGGYDIPSPTGATLTYAVAATQAAPVQAPSVAMPDLGSAEENE